MADLTYNVYSFKGERTLKTDPVTLSFADDATEASFTIEANAKVHTMHVVHPAFSDPVTLTITVTDENGAVLYQSDPIANADETEIIHELETYLSINGECTVTAELSGVHGGEGDEEITISMVLTR